MNEKLKYKVLQPIGLDGRREVGEIIELDELTASNYPGKLVRVADKVAEAAKPEKAINDMTLPELVEKATSLNLVSSGSRADLLERINLYLEGKTESKPEEAKPSDASATSDQTKPEEAKPSDASADTQAQA